MNTRPLLLSLNLLTMAWKRTHRKRERERDPVHISTIYVQIICPKDIENVRKNRIFNKIWHTFIEKKKSTYNFYSYLNWNCMQKKSIYTWGNTDLIVLPCDVLSENILFVWNNPDSLSTYLFLSPEFINHAIVRLFVYFYVTPEVSHNQQKIKDV